MAADRSVFSFLFFRGAKGGVVVVVVVVFVENEKKRQFLTTNIFLGWIQEVVLLIFHIGSCVGSTTSTYRQRKDERMTFFSRESGNP